MIELVVVVVVIGLITLMLGASIGQVGAASRARLLVQSADQIARVWDDLCRTAGVSTQVSGSPVPVTGATPLDVVVRGISEVHADFRLAFQESGLVPMGDSIHRQAAGSYRLLGYPVQMAGGGSEPISITFTNVPDAVVLAVATLVVPRTSSLAASDATGERLRYGAVSNGVRWMTLRVRVQ